MSLSKKFYFTDADEARILVRCLTSPLEVVQRWRYERGRVWSEMKDRFEGLRPDEYQGNHPREYEMRKLETETRLMDLALSAIEPIRIGVDRIHSQSRLVHSLQEVYDLYASELKRCGQPLTEPLLTEGIPVSVFSVAIDKKWIPYPLRRLGKGVGKEFLDGWNRPFFSRAKKKGWSERFGPYGVPKGFGAWFEGHLESRAAHWRTPAPKGQGEVRSANTHAPDHRPEDLSGPVPAPKPDAKKRSPILITRDAVIEQNPEKSALELCGLFDEYSIRLPDAWTEEFREKTWVEAYRNPKLRPRIDTIISKTRRRLR